MIPQKKALRDIQIEQELLQQNRDSNGVRPNTWSSVSASKPTSITHSYSTNTNRGTKQPTHANAWDKPTAVRPKRVSMTPAAPSASISAPRSSVSRQLIIKSEPRGPSEDFIKWCELSLRGLNPGVNGTYISNPLRMIKLTHCF